MTPSSTVRVASACGAGARVALGAASAETANATHVRPKGAHALRVPLVPAQQPCTTPNGPHEPPLNM